MSILDLTTLLIFLAAVFTLINITVLKLPATIGLMAIALMMSVSILILGVIFPSVTEAASTVVDEFDFQEVLLNVMLNFLLFAGALSVDLNKLLEEKIPILILSLLGTFISTVAVGVLIFYVFPLLGVQLSFVYCLLFGALISPTDPIAVLALIKKYNLSKNLEIKIAGESLFNDGVGVVFFLTVLGIAKKGMDSFDIGEVAFLFGTEVIGGLLMGAVFGYLGFKLLNYIDNDHVELEVLVTLTMVMVGGRIAELLHISAPLAMVIMGLFIGNEGRDEALANATGKYVFKFWHLLDEALNAILFILIGLEIIVIIHVFTGKMLIASVAAIVIVLFARFLGVIIPIGMMKPFRKFEPKTVEILTWGGLRGGLSIACALSLSELSFIEPFAKELILFITYAIVVFSILVQGLTVPLLLKKG